MLAVRLNPEKAKGESVKLAFVLTDSNERTYITIANGVLVHQEIAPPSPVDAKLTLMFKRENGITPGAQMEGSPSPGRRAPRFLGRP